MLNIRIEDCEHCSEISSVLCQIDKKIGTLTKEEYNSIAFLSPKSSNTFLKKLLYYRNIFDNLYWNSNYYCFPYKDIVSKVKTFLAYGV